LLGCGVVVSGSAGVMALAAGEVPGVAVDAESRRLLESGQVAILSAGKEGDASKVVVAIIIDRPVIDVWDVVGDEEAAPEYVDDLKMVKIIEEGPDYRLMEQKAKVSILLPAFNFVLKCWNTPHREMRFERQSGDFKHLEGDWQFVPLDGGARTLLVHRLVVDPGLFVPKAIIRSGMKLNLPKMMLALRERVYALKGAPATD
jgi:ribosome-associated toxin RatA of RatAB toxin-antitoxin module